MSYYIQPCIQNPDAEFVVLSSGLGGHANFWKPQIEFLSQYFHVLSYDQEGCHAEAELLSENYLFQNLAKQIFEIIQQEQVENFHFIGHAIGSFIGAELAILCQEFKQDQTCHIKMKSLSCINAWDQLDPHTAKCFEARVHLLKHAGAEAYVRAQALFLYPPAWISRHYLSLTDAENQQLQNFPPMQNVLSRINAVRHFKVNENHRKALTDVVLHFIANEDDFLVPVQKSKDLRQFLGHGSLSILVSGAHASTVTETNTVNSKILQFYQQEKWVE